MNVEPNTPLTTTCIDWTYVCDSNSNFRSSWDLLLALSPVETSRVGALSPVVRTGSLVFLHERVRDLVSSFVECRCCVSRSRGYYCWRRLPSPVSRGCRFLSLTEW